MPRTAGDPASKPVDGVAPKATEAPQPNIADKEVPKSTETPDVKKAEAAPKKPAETPADKTAEVPAPKEAPAPKMAADAAALKSPGASTDPKAKDAAASKTVTDAAGAKPAGTPAPKLPDQPLAVVTPGPVLTPGPVVTPVDPWADAIAAFATADANRPSTGGVVFVGSSSIRLWSNLENQFKDFSAVNRGFGGSTLADCVKYLDRLVLPHKPRFVVVYAGDNDIASGRTPQQVLDDFVALANRVHDRLPKTQIAFVSIKPSPARADLLSRVRETNTRIRDFVATQPYITYVDVFTPMLDAKGQPRGELFGGDSLHLNAEGYALWSSLISPVLPLDEQPAMVKNNTEFVGPLLPPQASAARRASDASAKKTRSN